MDIGLGIGMIDFNIFLKDLQNKSRNINIKYKDESTLMKIIGHILFFNPKFMTDYVTTIGNTIYFPKYRNFSNVEDIEVLAHEFVHIIDYNKHKILFPLLYLFPQILAPLFLVLLPFNWVLSLVLFVLFLCPLPSYFRYKYELRAYKMSLFVANEILLHRGFSSPYRKEVLLNISQNINTQFTSAAYYFMWPFGAKKQLTQEVTRVIEKHDDILNNDIYRDVFNSLNISKK